MYNINYKQGKKPIYMWTSTKPRNNPLLLIHPCYLPLLNYYSWATTNPPSPYYNLIPIPTARTATYTTTLINISSKYTQKSQCNLVNSCSNNINMYFTNHALSQHIPRYVLYSLLCTSLIHPLNLMG